MSLLQTGPFRLYKAAPNLVPCSQPGCGRPADLLWFDRNDGKRQVTLFRVICSGWDCWCANQSRTYPRQDEAERSWNKKNEVKAPTVGAHHTNQ